MTERQKNIREIVLISVSLVYLAYAFRIGFWITGDMHSGGPLVGVLLFPLFVALVAIPLYWNLHRTRSICGLVVGIYLIVGATLFLIWN